MVYSTSQGAYNESVKGIVATFVTALAVLGAAPASGAARGLAEDLAPRPIRWHFLPGTIAGAFIGRGGTCFYLARGKPAETVSVSPAGVVAPGFQPLLLDARGTLWCMPQRRSAIVGVKGGTVVERPPAKAASFGTIDVIDGATELQTSAYEDTAGRVWFGNSRGVQWFDGKDWHSKDLAERNSLDVSVPMSALHVVEDGRGRLYFWARWPVEAVCGTDGFWTFDGKTWANHTTRDGLPHNRLEAVCPLDDGAVLVNTVDGRLVRFSMKKLDLKQEVGRLVRLLNDKRWKVRERATESLVGLGRRAELELKTHLATTKQPEVRSRIRMALAALRRPGPRQWRLLDSVYLCESVTVRPPRWRRRPVGGPEWLATAAKVVDTSTGETFAEATFALSARSVRRIKGWPTPHKAGRTWALADGRGGWWIGRRRDGLLHWDGNATIPLADAATRSFCEIFGRDRHGRVLLSHGTGVAAYWPGRPDTRRGLASRSWRVGNYGVWAIDSRGRVWAKRAGSQAPLSRYERGAWQGVAGLGGTEPTTIIPGRRGSLFVNLAGADGGFRFLADGKWHKSSGLLDLVRKDPARVKRHIDNSQTHRSSHYALAVDARGRTWVLSGKRLLLLADGETTNGGRAVVGATASFPWLALLRPYDAGRMLLFAQLPGRAYHIRCGREKPAVAACPKDCRGFTLFEKHLVDGAGRLWHGAHPGRACIHAGDRVRRAPAPGIPMLCDSAGRVWLCEVGAGYHVVPPDGGRPVKLDVPVADGRSPLCEARPGEVWIACSDGLRRFRAREGRISAAGVFRKGFPGSQAAALAADRLGALWLLTSAPEGYNLTRINLPDDDTK